MNRELTSFHKWLILLNVSVSIFMATLDGSIVNVALPVVSRELAADIGSVQWVVTSYLLTISVLLLVWGKISDIYGRKKIFAFGFIIFTAGSLMCGLSADLKMLVLSRVVQAIGASAMMALSQGIVAEVFPANERGKALGITGATVAIGSLVGPSLGGVLTHAFNWQSIFLINIPIGILGAVLTFTTIPEMHRTAETKKFDFKGSVMLVTAILLLFISLLFLQERILPLKIFIPLLLLGVALLFIFISYEKNLENPLIRLELFKIKVFSLGLSSAFLSFVAMSASLIFIPFYLQYVLGVDTRAAGLLISFYPAASAIVAPISGRLSDKYSYRPLTVLGLSINTAVLFAVAALNESSSFLRIAVLMALLGAGGAIFQSPNNSSVMGAVPREQLGIAGGINALFRNLGMVSGTALSVLIFTFTSNMDINNFSGQNGAFDAVRFLNGFRVVIIFAAVMCMLGALISLTRSVGAVSGSREKA
ncbi:EmrB/QacA subfamily drug resistance transporter [Anaerobacterium chartisolvens]|uniref:EmrB/QacA subfamily drug resistance transporter n=1 Tax=Anaerobacterium chartisolvens TaxID=1297424 RepID=A0A369B2Y3_9FIRM|nr:MFS transporter [Anaerobacterium chartisolvens]RCX14806.1 EmrB/QacA subfamily drug resistance transporter [Anaerobacterium chartisolvens]